MKNANPMIIPRNHKIEEALAAANLGNKEVMDKLLFILNRPYNDKKITADFQSPAPLSNKKYQTFCGT